VYGFDAASISSRQRVDAVHTDHRIRDGRSPDRRDRRRAGIDAGLHRPVDLSISLGVFGQYESDRYVQAVATVREACKRHGKAMGTGAYSRQHGLASRDAGDQFLLALVDDQALRESASANIAALRGNA